MLQIKERYRKNFGLELHCPSKSKINRMNLTLKKESQEENAMK